MQWLIIVENQEKANAFRMAIPNITAISTRGTPFEIEIELEENKIGYKILCKKKWAATMNKIRQTAYQSDAILLALDPTPLGEACAAALEQMLENKKCTRWKPESLRKEDIQKALWDLENMPPENWAKCQPGLAMSHWIQATMDIVWTSRVSQILSEIRRKELRMTRMMASLLKMVEEEENTQKADNKGTFWEMSLEVVPINNSRKTQQYFQAQVIVPQLTEFKKRFPKKFTDTWVQKIADALEKNRQGYSTYHPKPGNTWYYESLSALKLHKNHISKFPYFIIDQITDYETVKPSSPPFTAEDVQIYAAEQRQGSPEDTQRCLLELYYQGVINNPKNTKTHLSPKTINSLIKMGRKMGWQLEKEPRAFGDNPESEQEALHPTSWTLLPDSMECKELLLKDSPTSTKSLKTLKHWLYKQIYWRAKESQERAIKWKEKKVYLYGPLFLTRTQLEKQIAMVKTSESKKDKLSFNIKKHHSLHCHMQLLISFNYGETEANESKDLIEVKPNDIYVCEYIHMNEKTLPREDNLKRENFITKLVKVGVGRIETIKSTLNHLLDEGLLKQDQKDRISLTQSGQEILNILSLEFGQFIDSNYHKLIEQSLADIRESKISGQSFLNEWWQCLKILCLEESSLRNQNNPKSLKL